MSDLARWIYLESSPGVPTLLRPAGNALENAYVYDSVARDLKALAGQGLLRIDVEESRQLSGDTVICRLAFTRLR
ncbi:MAG TPA: hypothetical protein VMU47_20610 [Caldimonas sp.]|nr:hypothetical protein [Caldimonas sp.]